jgi:hypothetical protein
MIWMCSLLAPGRECLKVLHAVLLYTFIATAMNMKARTLMYCRSNLTLMVKGTANREAKPVARSDIIGGRVRTQYAFPMDAAR